MAIPLTDTFSENENIFLSFDLVCFGRGYSKKRWVESHSPMVCEGEIGADVAGG